MKKITLILLYVLFMPIFILAQQKNDWSNWNYLMGDWKGKGSGDPGMGGGTFSFTLDLDAHIIVRKAKTTFPAQQGRPYFTHEDLLIVYNDGNKDSSSAVYFDNEGHTIHYSIGFNGKSIILLSEKKDGMPIFRLSYVPVDENTVNVKFEISQDGKSFSTYIEGESVRVKA